MSLIFKKCDICGNEVLIMCDSGNNIICCGKPMKVISPSIIENGDVHTPLTNQSGNEVTVVLNHHIDDKHHIDWVIIETNQGFHKKDIKVGEDVVATFSLAKDEFVMYTYVYCNIHGLYRD